MARAKHRGIFLHPAYWGRGLATEVVQAAVAHGFDRLLLPAIGAFARPENGASIRVLEKCGFAFLRHEPALARHHYEIRRDEWLGGEDRARIRPARSHLPPRAR